MGRIMSNSKQTRISMKYTSDPYVYINCLAGGTKGNRIALPNAEIMIHQPAIQGAGVFIFVFMCGKEPEGFFD